MPQHIHRDFAAKIVFSKFLKNIARRIGLVSLSKNASGANKLIIQWNTAFGQAFIHGFKKVLGSFPKSVFFSMPFAYVPILMFQQVIIPAAAQMLQIKCGQAIFVRVQLKPWVQVVRCASAIINCTRQRR